jgi:polysaccharide export outer membrane protein
MSLSYRRTATRLSIWLVATFLIAGICSARTKQEKVDKDTKKDDSVSASPKVGDTDTTYRIGVEDELQVTVWKEPELATQAVVRPDGKITFPLLNDVVVTGLTADELQKVLAEKLKPYVNEPQVTVTIRAIHSRKVYLVGQVARQGSYPLNGSKTVLELIADAGGLNAFAKGGAIYVLRSVGGNKVKLPFNYKKALAGKSENLNLMPGDVVVVP